MTEQSYAPQSIQAQERGKALKSSLNQRPAIIFCLASMLTGSFLAGSLLLSAPGALAQTADKERPAKDMRYRKRTIIAPTGTELPRRIDFQSLSTRDALLLPTYVPQYGKNFSGGAPVAPTRTYNPNEAQTAQAGTLDNTAKPVEKGLPRASREGIVPPAPPAHSSYLPKSLSSESTKTAAHSVEPPVATKHAPTAAKVAQLKTQADLLVKNGKLADAQSLLENSLHEYGDHPALKSELSKVSLLRARSYAKAGNHELAAKQARIAAAHAVGISPDLATQANKSLDEALVKSKVNPNSAEARSTLGEKLSGQGRYLEAEVEYRAAVNLKPSVDGNIAVGDAASKAGRKQEAKAAYQEALELNPDSQKALKLLGITRYQLNDYVGANADLTRALVLNPMDIQAGDTLLSLWHHQVASRPQDANAHLGLARAYQVIGDLKSAQIEYKTVVALNPNHPNLPAARQSFKLALAKQEAYKAYDQAMAMERDGNLLSAFQKANEAVSLYPSEKEFQNYKDFLGSRMRANQGVPLAVPTEALTPAMAQLAQPGEQPPSLNLPTAQAIGLAGSPMATAAQTQTQTLSPFAHENGYAPLNTDTHVASIAGFLDSMRTFTMQQQSQIHQQEDSTKQILRALTGHGGSSEAALPTTAGNFSLGSAQTNGISGAAAGASAGALPLSSGALPPGSGALPPSSGSAADALKAAALALGNTSAMGGSLGEASSAGASSATTSGGTAPKAPSVSSSAPQSLAGIALSAGDTFSNKKQSLMGNFASFGASALPTLASGKVKTITKQDVGQIIEKTANRYGFGTKGQASKTASPAAASAKPAAPTNTALSEQPQFMTQTQYMPQPQLMPQTQYMPQGDPFAPQAPSIQQAQFIQQQPQFAQQAQYTPQAQTGSPASVYSAQASINAVTAAQQANIPNSQPDPVGALQARNTELQNQLASAQQTILSLQNKKSNPFKTQPSTAQKFQLAQFAQNKAGSGQTVTAPFFAQGDPTLLGTNSTGGVHIYLTGVKAGKSEVQLKVTLRNESGTTIKLPSSSKAIVRSGGKETSTKIKFSNHAVNTGDSVTGQISVAGANLDPSADIFVPAGSLVASNFGDLHLTAPISQK